MKEDKSIEEKTVDSARLEHEFEHELFKLVNSYASRGLSKPALIRRLKWVLGSAEMS